MHDNDDAAVVGEDFYLATAADIVADPSAPEAFVHGLREQREWVWDNGVLSPAAVERLERQLHAASVKTVPQRKHIESAVFESFMKALRQGTTIS